MIRGLGPCGLGLNFSTFCLFPSACQKQAKSGSLKDAMACGEKPEHLPSTPRFICGSIGDPEASGQGFALLPQGQGQGASGSILL